MRFLIPCSPLQVNREMFQAVKNGFHILGFTIEEINAIYRILSGILHLGEIDFDTAADGESCHIKGKTALESGRFCASTNILIRFAMKTL